MLEIAGLEGGHGGQGADPTAVAAAHPAEGSRDAAICGRYRSGETLCAIARSFELSIEGVRKITRRYGLDKTNAGLAVRKLASLRPPKARPAWERVYGCSLLDYSTATHEERMAFLQHRSNARRKDIAWSVSLGDWVRVWRQSGKWERRGQGPRRFGMTRRDPARGFTADNLLVAKNAVSLHRARRRQVAGTAAKAPSRRERPGITTEARAGTREFPTG